MAQMIDDFLNSCRMTDGAKIMFLYLIRQPERSATLEELSALSGRGPASISRWTRQLSAAKMLKINYGGCKKAVYVAIDVAWEVRDK